MLWQVGIYSWTFRLFALTGRQRLLDFLLWRISSFPWFLRKHLSVVGCSSSGPWVGSCFWIVQTTCSSTNCWFSAHTIVTQMSCVNLWWVSSHLATRAVQPISNWIWRTTSRRKSWLYFCLRCAVCDRLIWTKALVEILSLGWSLLAIAAFWLGRSSSGWLSLCGSVRADIVTAVASWSIG